MEHITTYLIFLPIAASLLILVLAKLGQEGLPKMIALATTVVAFLLSLVALSKFEVGAGIQFVHITSWIPEMQINYNVGMDGLSLLLVVLTNLLMIISVLASWTAVKERQTEFYFFLLALHTGIVGTFCSFDMFLFYVFWELMLIPMYFLIGIWGSDNRKYATMKFVLYTLVGSVLMLAALMYLYYKAGNVFEYQGLVSYLQNASFQELPIQTRSLLFLAFFFAFAIKVPLFPLHTWLPDAHTEAPTAGSIILAGVLLKTGAYGIMRFCIPFFPYAAVHWAPMISWLAVIAIIYGAMTAIIQRDMKRLVAYSSVSHMGFIVLGIFAFTTLGYSGSILQMISHGITTGGLFLGVGILYERRHTRLLSEYGGLAGVMKKYCVLMIIIVLASAGLPGLNGFIGEFLILMGTFTQVVHAENAVLWTALAATGVILGAVYLLIMVQKVFFGKITNPKNEKLLDLNPREMFSMCVLVALAIWIGVYPKPFLNIINNSYAVKTLEVRMKPIVDMKKNEQAATNRNYR